MLLRRRLLITELRKDNIKTNHFESNTRYLNFRFVTLPSARVSRHSLRVLFALLCTALPCSWSSALLNEQIRSCSYSKISIPANAVRKRSSLGNRCGTGWHGGRVCSGVHSLPFQTLMKFSFFLMSHLSLSSALSDSNLRFEFKRVGVAMSPAESQPPSHAQ